MWVACDCSVATKCPQGKKGSQHTCWIYKEEKPMRMFVSDHLTKSRAHEERDWGYYVVIYEHPGIKIKVLHINAGQRIPAQFHKYHDEHWMVLEGEGVALLSNEENTPTVHTLEPGQIIDVASNRVHEISAGADAPLEFLEVQVALIVPGGDAEMIKEGAEGGEHVG